MGRLTLGGLEFASGDTDATAHGPGESVHTLGVLCCLGSAASSASYSGGVVR